MELIIADTNNKRIGMIETASVIWHVKYYDTGSFEIHTAIDPVYLSLLKKDYRVIRPHRKEVGIIEDIQMEIDQETKENYITVTGRFAESFLDRRIILRQTQINDTLPAAIEKLINENVIRPTDTKRRINIQFANEISDTAMLQTQFTGTNLLTTIHELCQTYGIGIGSRYINNGGDFSIELYTYAGIDRSYSQNDNPWIVFSDEYDTLLSSSYIETNSEHRTFALVAGEGEGLERRTAVVDYGQIAENRKEIFIDARDISSNEGEVPPVEYNNLLIERGKQKLVDYQITKVFDADVVVDNMEYYKDYFLGDIVVVANTIFDIEENRRIIEILESEDASGYSIQPVFAEEEYNG